MPGNDENVPDDVKNKRQHSESPEKIEEGSGREKKKQRGSSVRDKGEKKEGPHEKFNSRHDPNFRRVERTSVVPTAFQSGGYLHTETDLERVIPVRKGMVFNYA